MEKAINFIKDATLWAVEWTAKNPGTALCIAGAVVALVVIW